MEKIVKKPLKIDFHIHSCYSKYKDELKLVKDGTIDNIQTLVDKLEDHNINMCAITDHDYFSYDLYKALKSFEGKGSIKKVFPGVEFSVGMKSDSGTLKQVHVICIFDDEDDEKVKNIHNCIPFKNGKIDYDENTKFFNEERFISILRDINLNVITIAHQKGSITSSSAAKSKNDVSSLGAVKFNELMYCEYFESFEFKSMKNGLYNNAFAVTKNAKYDQIRFITGSDCHDWNVYPKHDKQENDNLEFKFTYLKCLPCFRGLAMAFSDFDRISIKDYAFNTRAKKIDNFKIFIDGTGYDIPLSDGINVIIGDNSIGKSLLLHKMTNYKWMEGNNTQIKNGYEAYLDRNKIKIQTQIDQELVHTFDYQGGIRDRFDSDNQDNRDFLANKFPLDMDQNEYKPLIENEFKKMYNALENKFEYDNLKKTLNTLVMVDEEVISKNISCKKTSKSKKAYNNEVKLDKYYSKIINAIQSPDYHLIEDEDEKETINSILSTLNKYQAKHQEKSENLLREYNLKNAIDTAINEFNNDVSSWKSDLESKKNKFDNESSIDIASTIADLIAKKKQIVSFKFDIKTTEVKPNKLIFGSYTFVKKFKNCKSIDNKYLKSILKRVLKQNVKINYKTITEETLKDKILDIRSQRNEKALSILKSRINSIIDDDLKSIPSIIRNGDDVYNKLSSGMNSSIYFDILSTDKSEGIYLVDQPEDDVSQRSIKDSIIKNFKEMSGKRQIIMITHNPQFVVNLDVDTVICISKNDEHKIEIKSGALEYSDDNTDILDIVAKNLDGGIESIRKRWKRYDKGIKANS